MSFIGSLFGQKGAAQADLQNPVTSAQANQSLAGVQGSIQQQQALLAALQGQGGLSNQANVFQQQQALANALQQQAAGQGPNPAQAQLAQATAANTANQAALMAGQRGTQANAGLIARQAAMQGAANQQNAAGQAATLGAQQQIAAQQQLAAQQQAMQNVAANQVGNQIGATSGLNQMNQNLYGTQLGQINSQNQAALGNAEMQNKNIQSQNELTGKVVGGLLGGAAAYATMGGAPTLAKLAKTQTVAGGPMDAGNVATGTQYAATGGMIKPMHEHLMSYFKNPQSFAEGGRVEPVNKQGTPNTGVSYNAQQEKEKKVPVVKHIVGAKASDPTTWWAEGGKVPGTPEVDHDSYENDKVPAMLSPGEIVLPLHVVNHKEAPKKAAEFVAAILAKQARKKQ